VNLFKLHDLTGIQYDLQLLFNGTLRAAIAVIPELSIIEE
jgi:hypothetical protein